MPSLLNIQIFTIIVSVTLSLNNNCYLEKKIGVSGLAKKQDTSLSYTLSDFSKEQKQAPKDHSISELDKKRYFYRKNGSRDALISSIAYIYQKEFDAFESFWLKRVLKFSKERQNILNSVSSGYSGCFTDEGNLFYSRSFKVLNVYAFPVSNLKAKFNKKRIEEVNNDKFSKMNKIFEGIFKLVDKINEIGVSDDRGYDIPVLKKLEDLDIGVKKYNPEAGFFSEDDIVFRDTSNLIAYIPDFFEDLLKKFTDFGNFADVNAKKLKIINLYQLYIYWEKSVLFFFPISFEMENCLTQRNNIDPFFVVKCPSLIVNLLNKLDDEEYKCLKFLGDFKFPKNYEKFKSALWKIIKLSSELNEAIRVKFDYEIPLFDREKKLFGLVFQDSSAFEMDRNEIESFNLLKKII